MCHVQAVGDSQTGLLLGALAQKPLSGWALCEISTNAEKRRSTCSQEGSAEGSAPTQINSDKFTRSAHCAGAGWRFSVCLLGHSCCSGANTQCPPLGSQRQDGLKQNRGHPGGAPGVPSHHPLPRKSWEKNQLSGGF